MAGSIEEGRFGGSGPMGPPMPQHGGNGNGNGKDLHARLSVVENELKNLATKADIQSVKVWVLVGVLGAAGIVSVIVFNALRFIEVVIGAAE